MKSFRSSEKAIFLEALDIESAEERLAFVQAACRGDQALFSSVSALLHEHERKITLSIRLSQQAVPLDFWQARRVQKMTWGAIPFQGQHLAP